MRNINLVSLIKGTEHDKWRITALFGLERLNYYFHIERLQKQLRVHLDEELFPIMQHLTHRRNNGNLLLFYQ